MGKALWEYLHTFSVQGRLITFEFNLCHLEEGKSYEEEGGKDARERYFEFQCSAEWRKSFLFLLSKKTEELGSKKQ